MSIDKVAAFAGTLAEFYDRYNVPLSFAPYAEVVADRTKALFPRRVLETAAGTGVVTEALAALLFCRLGLDESHVWPTYRFADRLSIRGIVLLAFQIGLHVGRGHQANSVAKCL